MTTAEMVLCPVDSVLISISHIITSDFIYPARPQATPNTIAWAGRFVSLCVCALALIVSMTWKSGITLLMQVVSKRILLLRIRM